ncbi:hypothetical protein BDW62DRAFT_72895 [Aspergillus aurantiobrunneus]
MTNVIKMGANVFILPPRLLLFVSVLLEIPTVFLAEGRRSFASLIPFSVDLMSLVLPRYGFAGGICCLRACHHLPTYRSRELFLILKLGASKLQERNPASFRKILGELVLTRLAPH